MKFPYFKLGVADSRVDIIFCKELFQKYSYDLQNRIFIQGFPHLNTNLRACFHTCLVESDKCKNPMENIKSVVPMSQRIVIGLKIDM